ncbi:unnamed protein product [Eruca vesicaria subsp. sativa]|uniref:Disease resistance RPP13-like protein 4 n=1 Tax=Eruca vesicaria subsp. sativa TaxID=29727 RepID=A0ABC8M194_ERUVS|nr:unnamed protein product [Eruca vesicaria subsp. sativa]
MASKELSPQVPKPKDDPKTTIQEILKIVDQLHTKLLPSQTQDIITTSRSTGGGVHKQTCSQTNNKKKRLESVSSSPAVLVGLKDSEDVVPKLQRNLRMLNTDVIKLQELNQDVGYEVRKHFTPLNNLLKKVESSKPELTKGMKKDLEDINMKMFNLMKKVPMLPNKGKKPKGIDSHAGEEDNYGKCIAYLPGLHANQEAFKRLAVFRDVQNKFKELSTDRKICLLSLAVFPENQKVNRTMLMYWWIGEGIIPYRGTQRDKEKPENVVKEILKDFTDRNLIEPVENRRKVEPNSYMMNPFVHSSVVVISREIGLFDMYHKGKKPRMRKSELKKVCLVEGSSSQPEAKTKKMPAEDIETVFNVSERFPDFTLKWFSEEQSQKKNILAKTSFNALKVFYMGRWERTPYRHIDAESPEFMKYVKHMSKLRLLSFQGISRIEKLDNGVCELSELVILDLRACYSLERLPENIDSLKALVYLDISECYMIGRMPKRLSWLDNLEVLKGFVVSDVIVEEKVCTLAELVHLRKLRKLSITINKEDFGVVQLFEAIKDFLELENLKVAWGLINEQKNDGEGVRKFLRTTSYFPKSQARPLPLPELPKKLKKLDLQCFPDPDLPTWLKPQNLDVLEKLYIQGATKLTGFGKLLPENPTKCNVKVLRLKYLPRLVVDWIELRNLYFPKLEFLEKYQCPQVSFCPTDGIGIWHKP